MAKTTTRLQSKPGQEQVLAASATEILESMNEAFYAISRDWRIIYANHHALNLWKLAREDVVGRKLLDVLPSLAGSTSLRALQEAMADGQLRQMATVSPVLRRHVEFSIYPSKVGLSIYFRDISQREQIERELRERNEILTLAEESSGLGVWNVDLETEMVRGTPHFFRMMGLSPSTEPVHVDSVRQLRHPDDRDRVMDIFRQATTSGSDAFETEYRIIRPDGQLRWIFARGRVLRDSTGRPLRYSGIDIDVTERKVAEAALAESEERLRLAQEAAGIGIWDWDIAGGITRWSNIQSRLHGFERRDVGPSHEEWKAIVHPDDRDKAAEAVLRAVATNSPYEADYRVTLPEGTVRWLAARGSVRTDYSGKPVRMLGITVDVTERRAATEALDRLNQELEKRVTERTMQLREEAVRRAEAEGRLHQAQKMEAVGQLTGGVAHDFNNLLTVILGNLDRIKRRLGDGTAPASPVLRESLVPPVDMAMQAVRNAAQLTHRLLAFSRRQPLEPRVLDLNRLVTGMSDMISRTLSATIQVETVLGAGLWPTFADTNQLESALLNLVVNARDAMPNGGRLTVETANAHLDERYSAATDGTPPGQYVMLGVTDTGTGIPKELLDKVFEPFFTTKDVGIGSGLGLSMVYGFVKQSGGHVRIYSEVGQGTTVKIYLPRHLGEMKQVPPATAGEAAVSVLPRAATGETILLVEDDEKVRQFSVSALEDLGYEVLQAADAAAALRLVDALSDRKIDLLFTDVVLPGGMSGRVLADTILQRRPDLPVLFTTGYTRNAIIHNDRLDPGVHLLGKPYNLDDLARKVRALIDASRRG